MRVVWVNEEGDEEHDDHASIGWQAATIDEMEIEAVTVGLAEARRLFPDMDRFERILVFSDSSYVVNSFVKAMRVWPNRKWRGANGMPVANIGLWKRLRKEVQRCPLRVHIEWVKAHERNPHNCAADSLARTSASAPFQRALSVDATTKKWSDRKTIRGCVKVTGQVMTIRIVSREHVRQAKVDRYRYEVIDPDDKHFKDLDFAFCKLNLSRNKCYEVRMNNNQMKPTIEEVLSELDCADYKYT